MTNQLFAWDGTRAQSGRVVVERKLLEIEGLALTVASEDVSAPTDWCFEESHHIFVVHLAGHLNQMESVFSAGPSSNALPSIGDIWIIPAGCRYAALAQGDQAHFAEFRVPTASLEAGKVAARVGHRDSFLHHASAKAAALAARDDDLAGLALRSLLETLRFHITDTYLHNSLPDRGTASSNRRRFSRREQKLLLDCIHAMKHGPITVADLAAAAQVSSSQLLEGFKASFGTTPWQYILRVRLTDARQLLEATSMSATAIATATGFSSPSHFATTFTKHFGTSPTAYRLERRRGTSSASTFSPD